MNFYLEVVQTLTSIACFFAALYQYFGTAEPNFQSAAIFFLAAIYFRAGALDSYVRRKEDEER